MRRRGGGKVRERGRIARREMNGWQRECAGVGERVKVIDGWRDERRR